jgi:hypothetical protein
MRFAREQGEMASHWIDNGPVSLPPRSLAYGVATVLCLIALAGLGLGLRAAWRDISAPEAAGGKGESADGADVLTARPIVELPPPVAAPEAAKNVAASSDDDDDAKAQALAARTAAAQALQSKTSKAAGDIDDILTSSSEKPPAPTKPPADEAPPRAPVKSDVPF